MNKRKLFFILTTVVLLMATACSGSFIDPGMADTDQGSSNSMGNGGGGFGGGGGGGYGGGGGGGGGWSSSLSGTYKSSDSSYFGLFPDEITFTGSNFTAKVTISGKSYTYSGTYKVSDLVLVTCTIKKSADPDREPGDEELYVIMDSTHIMYYGFYIFTKT